MLQVAPSLAKFWLRRNRSWWGGLGRVRQHWRRELKCKLFSNTLIGVSLHELCLFAPLSVNKAISL